MTSSLLHSSQTSSTSPARATARIWELRPISGAAADQLREVGGVVRVADQSHSYPCRQCLRDAEVGEELILVSHDPFVQDSPYRSASPIFLHRRPCGQPDHGDQLPNQLAIRQLSVRAFDRSAMIVDASVIDGTELDVALDRMFATDATERVHVHFAGHGCWAVTAERRTASST